MKKLISLLALTAIIIACNTTEPPPPDNGNGIDTTSHNFTFETFTFGEHSSSVLYDVAVIDENNIWAVGEIFMNDSLGNPDPNAYNAVHWDGSEWKLRRIKTNACGGVIYPPIKAIFAFSANDILFAHIDGSITYYNGIEFINDCSLITQLNGSANKIWGTSKNDYYVVSGNGFIAHSTNEQWTKIESGTDLDINDVWGIANNDGTSTVLCAAYVFGSGGEKKLLKVHGFSVSDIDWMDNKELYTVWFKSLDKIYAGGEGLFYKTNNQWIRATIPNLFSFRVRGLGYNDIWTVGGFGLAAHFNGASWKSYDEALLNFGNYTGLSVTKTTVAMVGNEGSQAAVTIGKNN